MIEEKTVLKRTSCVEIVHQQLSLPSMPSSYIFSKKPILRSLVVVSLPFSGHNIWLKEIQGQRRRHLEDSGSLEVNGDPVYPLAASTSLLTS